MSETGHRFGGIHEPLAMEAGRADGEVHQRDLYLDALRAWTMTLPSMSFQRSGKLIERSDPESYNICLVQRGSMKGIWPDRWAGYEAGDLHVGSSSRPFEIRAYGPVSCVGVEIPRRLVPLPAGRVDRMIGRPLPSRNGVGLLAAQVLTHLTAGAGSYAEADAPRLGLVATDLVTALIGHALDEDDRCLPPETHRSTLILRIKSFIQQHLTDPGLTPGAVAAAHHISLSYLHRLFRDEPVTVAAWIRHQRLERARRDLADPRLAGTPVHAIAARWGFTRAADFTRAFRTAYGTVPTDHRHQALAAPRHRNGERYHQIAPLG